jgi:hypothetical protein
LFLDYATYIMKELDASGDGDISVGEVHNLYDKQTKLGRFSEWLNRHFRYNKVHNFWAELSTGLEVQLEEFTRAMKHVLASFVSGGSSNLELGLGESIRNEDTVALKTAVWEQPEDVFADDTANKNADAPVRKMQAQTVEDKAKLKKSGPAKVEKHRMLKLKFFVCGDEAVVPRITDWQNNLSAFALRAYGSTALIDPVQIDVQEPDLDGISKDGESKKLVTKRYALSKHGVRYHQDPAKRVTLFAERS